MPAARPPPLPPDPHTAALRASALAVAWASACLGALVLVATALQGGHAGLAALAGLAGGGLLGLGLGVWAGRRRLARAALQLLDAPDVDTPPELHPLADALQALQRRQQAAFDAQAAQAEQWRQRAHSDPLTGLPNRRHFLARLEAALAEGALPAGSGLLLLRLHDLQGLNRRVGHAAADRALLAIAEAVQAYPQRIASCAVGRLNGADFALLLPVGGIVQDTAAALADGLLRPLAGIDPQARVFAGAVELHPPVDAPRALALADAALARAEAGGQLSDAAAVDPQAAAVTIPATLLEADLSQGAQSWQRRIRRALDQGRVALADYPVRSADGHLLHLDCPLRVQLRPAGPMEPASRWLSLAIRSQLCAAVDEKALALALQAIRADGQARCVNVAAQSAASPEFVAAVAARLEQAPDAACRLWIDLPEVLALERPLLVRELARRWRPLGVMLGLEHAGEALARIPRLVDLGLDCVRIDGRFVNGLDDPGAADARRHLQALVHLVQSVGLQVTAEGVRDAADLAVLWELGFDAATGPAVAPEPPAPSPAASASASAGEARADLRKQTSAEAARDDALSLV